MIKFCSLYSGSSGNSIFISTGNTKLLIDAGLSGKRITEALHSIGEDPSELCAILVSHEHSDHIKGAGILSKRFNIPVYANEGTWDAMRDSIKQVSSANCCYFANNSEFEVGDFCVKAFRTPHDAADPVGFNFFASNKKVTVATDLGHINNELLDFFDKSDLILVESNHDVEMLRIGPYPWYLKKRILGETGHLSNDSAAELIVNLVERGTERFLLGHLSKENNFPELAYQTVYNALYEKNISAEKDIILEVAIRDRASKIIELV